MRENTDIFGEKTIIFCPEGTSVRDAIKLMSEHGIHHLPIVDKDGLLTGLLSDREVFSALAKGSELTTASVEELCLKSIPAVTERTDLEGAISMFEQTNATALPVLRDGKPIGLVTERDLIVVMSSLVGKGKELDIVEKGEVVLAENPMTQKLFSLLSSIGL